MAVTIIGIATVYVSDEWSWWRLYMANLYMTDISNVLIALHSATNWPLFYYWRCRHRLNRELFAD